uniref:uncharacterized protein LOC122604333 n=1 Tax=Erigeron canadensis TaxID=72917 RepID=UPI001CB975A8|nr:uncharacterized protein LOC122604333 [Erigeron canadensis]
MEDKSGAGISSSTETLINEGTDGKKRDEQPVNIKQPSYASKVQSGNTKCQVNFRALEPDITLNDVDIVLPKKSVRVVQNRFINTLYGYFLGKRPAFPVVEHYAKTYWKKFGIQRIMMNSKGYFFFKFATKEGMQNMFEGGPWLVRNSPIFPNVWEPNAELKKEDIKSLSVWIKIHNVPMIAYTDDGLSLLATKLGSPKQLDSYTSNMCIESWGRSSYARALIEISAEKDFKEV